MSRTNHRAEQNEETLYFLTLILISACGDPQRAPDGAGEDMNVADMPVEADAKDDASDDARPDEEIYCVTDDMQMVKAGEKVCVLEFYKQCLSGVLIGTTERCAPPPEVNVVAEITNITNKPLAGFDNVIYVEMYIENRGTATTLNLECTFEATGEDGTILFPKAYMFDKYELAPGERLDDPFYRDRPLNNPRKKATAKIECVCENEQAPWSQSGNVDIYEFTY